MRIYDYLQQASQATRNRLGKSLHHDKFMVGLAIAYGASVIVYLVWHHGFLTPDQFLVMAMLAALLLGRLKAFLWDWIPLILLLFGYEYVRGLVQKINPNVHIFPMIRFDRFVFGTVPTIALQARFYTPGQPCWYDYAAIILYFLHFVVPLTVAFVFWLKNRKLFKQYAAAMVLVSYLTYLTYLAFPAVPPWLAARAGFLPPVARIMDATLSGISAQIQLPTIYSYCGVNLVAAVPSLHAAYPLLTAIFVGGRAPKLIPVMAVYSVAVWVALVYLGEHYVFDVFSGIIYALLTAGLLRYWPGKKSAARN
jgi:hypothetical protein